MVMFYSLWVKIKERLHSQNPTECSHFKSICKTSVDKHVCGQQLTFHCAPLLILLALFRSLPTANVWESFALVQLELWQSKHGCAAFYISSEHFVMRSLSWELFPSFKPANLCKFVPSIAPCSSSVQKL